MSTSFHLGILSAMPEELGNIIKFLKNKKHKKLGDLDYYSGEWIINKDINIKVSLAWSGWGKVSAARATTRLISEGEKNQSSIDLFIFTGVAGSGSPSIKQNDLIIADSVMQHDMDAEPIFKKFVIPALKEDTLLPNKKIVKWAFETYSSRISKELKFIRKIQEGLIATGDSFISDHNKIKSLKKSIPKLKAVEMEGAAFAQVAIQEKINWLLIRVISDDANSKAELDFQDFLKVYEKNSINIIKILIESIPTYPYLN